MSLHSFNLQPAHLKDSLISLHPLQLTDFEQLFKVASDPEVWEQHPNKNRYQREVFENFFKGAMESGGAFLVYDAMGNAVGSSRFYDYNEEDKSVHIGYTFLAKSCWGKGYNQALKTLMLDYAFQFVEKVIFHVGSTNIRSQKAMTKLGAVKTGEIEVAYFGEAVKHNFVYEMTKASWQNR
ncbi:GNAT family N-acetyltransferase [Marivirga sp. S37H4]|uniref:GNAT family N-acetyltransferase n=1 Tax=Marivirga aurantiaca TaxID=2802615 RepID=A0A934X1S8_9BACT|nr:GNAT family N-acetyltransferase [Marivirga aurantiaca]MBK6267344.1 GNAT family N-acetyltransferase [Marivirga aurantiaca]